ncbi:MAG: GNAT family N-acetyltransferase [Chloroflexi bacterium]|nr:GNAT family N-acetyltransferase [Chloroflexota bacterium]
MNIRPIQEQDIEQVIQLFRANYGDDYAIPEFYDPQWVKRGIYSDNILWLVMEENGCIVASGACILNFGDYNDQIGEIGRLVVDPNVGGKGLGRQMLTALVDASDERVEFAFAEARTVHPKTQKICDNIGLVPVGFLPMSYKMSWRESFVLSGQLFGNGRNLRHPSSAEVIPAVAPLARRSLSNLELNETVTVRDNVRSYPIDLAVSIAPMTGSSLIRLLKIEQGRLVDPEIFGSMHIDQGMPSLAAQRTAYFVASEGERTLGAIGYFYSEHDQNVRITEMIAQENVIKGSLLRFAVEQAEQVHQAQLIECDVNASSPTIQQTLFDMGFLPAAYVPGMVFHNTYRPDVVRMIKLNIPWDLGPLELTEPSRDYFDVVAPAFERASAERMKKLPSLNTATLRGFTPLEAYLFQCASEELTPAPGTVLDPNALYIVLAGSVEHADQTISTGGCVNPDIVFGQLDTIQPKARESTRLLTLTRTQLTDLCDRYPRLGMKLYQNLAAYRNR